MVWKKAHRGEMAAQEIGTETAYHTQNLSHQTASASFPSFSLSPSKVARKGWEMVKGLAPERNRTEWVDGLTEPERDGTTGTQVPI